jgi:hypothetical protein
MGEGIAPQAASLAAQLANLLKARGWPVAKICARLRICTLSAMTLDDGDVRAARSLLVGICAKSEDAGAAWDRLYRDAHDMQSGRGSEAAQPLSRSCVAPVWRCAMIRQGRHPPHQPANIATSLRDCAG